MRWPKLIGLGVLLLIFVGLVITEWENSQLPGHTKYRFNLAIIVPDRGVTFVSYDPSEKSILALPFPTGMTINSRTSGEYSIASLYKLGEYQGRGGMFARQKIQGFMRVPIPGYIVTTSKQQKIKSLIRISLLKIIFSLKKTDTSLSRIDATKLLLSTNSYRYREVGESELIRTGIVEKNTYHPERLQDYIGTRLFDWGIGNSNTSVAIVNASGENGLGSDLADFLTNLGLDVVMVRSSPNDQTEDKTVWQVNKSANVKELSYIFQNLFGFSDPKVEDVSQEYRAVVLIKVGKDAKGLF